MTVVGVQAGTHRSRLQLVPGRLAPRVINSDATGAKVALVATTALLLGGDRVDLRLDIGPGAWLEIVEIAGTVAYNAEGKQSEWNVRATIGAGGLLILHGEPFVVADGANVLRRSTVELDSSAIACIRETVVLGRSGERGGALRLTNRVDRGGRPVLLEDLDLRDRAVRELPGVLGRAAVIDTVTLLGAAPKACPTSGALFELDGSAGTIGRDLRAELAGSPIALWWPEWSNAARHRYAAGLR